MPTAVPRAPQRHDGPDVETLEAEFQYPLYGPNGDIQGALLHAGDEPVQIVFEPHGCEGSEVCAALRPGETVAVEALPEPLLPGSEARHPVYRVGRLVALNASHGANGADARVVRHADAGGPQPPPARRPRAPFSGIVVRLNFTRDGEADGYVLDSGHFIHARPGSHAGLRLGVGDRVEADGASRPLAGGSGRVVDAAVINGRRLHAAS